MRKQLKKGDNEMRDPKKICFYLDNSSCIGVDFSNPLGGNPGVGGTQFMIWTLSYYLNKFESVNVLLLANIIDTLPKEIMCHQADDIFEAAKIAKEENVDVFVYRSIANKKIFKLIDELKLNSVAWAHNYARSEELKLISETKYIKRYVCVGKQQYDFLRDHIVFNKSMYIYNSIDFSVYDKYSMHESKETIICYIGSLVPSKGFHKVAEIWPELEKNIKSAKLYIIGTGKLYDRNAQLGEFGIAEKNYEKKFMKYLLNEDGTLKKNVKFFGILNGQRKLEIMSKATVGIVNPTAKTETFGIGAVEFQALGVPVVTRKSLGFLDTIKNDFSGSLVRNKYGLSKSIIDLACKKDVNKKYGENGKWYVKSKFDIKEICLSWIDMFNNIIEEKPVDQHLQTEYYFNNFKWLRELNRRMKKIPILRNSPSITDYESKIKAILKRTLYRLK